MKTHSKNNVTIKSAIVIIFIVLCCTISFNSINIAYTDDNISPSISKQNLQTVSSTPNL